jgi:hypothetical protein
MKSTVKWVHYYFCDYGREAVSEGLGSNTPSVGGGYWTQPTARRVFRRSTAGNVGRVMDPRPVVGLTPAGMARA